MVLVKLLAQADWRLGNYDSDSTRSQWTFNVEKAHINSWLLHVIFQS